MQMTLYYYLPQKMDLKVVEISLLHIVKITVGFEGRIWDRIVSVPDHCLSFLLIANHKRMSWVACVECLLKPIGVSTSEAYLPTFSSVVKRKLFIRFKTNLTKTIGKSSDTNQGNLRTYAYFEKRNIYQ